MREYHILELENLDRHPKTLAAFETWLRQAFDAVQRWLEQEIDESDKDFCTAVVRRSSLTASRLGAGHLAEHFHIRHMHASALAVLGRMLVWCQEQRANGVQLGGRTELTVDEAAQELGVHPKTVRKYIAEGALIARDAAPPSSQHHDWRIPFSAVTEMRAGYQQRSIPAPIKIARPHVKRFKPNRLSWGKHRN
jgi:hypothetical protein